MHHILIPTDFSSNAYNAIKYAISLMENEEATFYLVNAYQTISHHPGYFSREESNSETKNYILERSKKGLKKVEGQINALEKNPNHTFKVIPLLGIFINTIEKFILENSIELIVMGAQGETDDTSIFIGSNTLEVIKQIDCPVIAVPQSYTYKVPKQLLLSIDLDKEVQNPYLDSMNVIANMHQSTINILKIKKEEKLSDTCLKNIDYLTELYKGNECNFHFVESKSVLTEIEKFENENQIDLLVMVNNKHSFFQSLLSTPIVNKMVLHTKLPLLVLPSKTTN